MDSTPFFLESLARLLERFGLGLSDRTSLPGVSEHVGHSGPSRQSDGQVSSEGSRCDRASESPRHDRACCKASCREDIIDRCAILGPTLDASARARDPRRHGLLDGSRSDVASGPRLALGQASLWVVRCALASPNIAERPGTRDGHPTLYQFSGPRTVLGTNPRESALGTQGLFGAIESHCQGSARRTLRPMHFSLQRPSGKPRSRQHAQLLQRQSTRFYPRWSTLRGHQRYAVVLPGWGRCEALEFGA